MIFSSSEVLPIAESTGFRAETIEKVLHLFNLLDKLNRHPMLTDKWVLKGGTALNLFVFDLPSLSVDMNRKDWRTVSIADVDFDPDELARLLIPALNRRFMEKQGSLAEHKERLVKECQTKLEAVLPFNDPEREFLDLLLKKGKSMRRPSRLTKRFRNASKTSRFSNGRPLT